MFTIIVLVTLALSTVPVLLPAPVLPVAGAQTAYSGYVMGYFTESPSGAGADYGLHLAVSSDGLEWSPLNQNAPVVTPAAGTGGLRDPFILRKQDGTFVVLATDMRGTDFTEQNQYIHVWDSADLTTFTGYRRVRLHDLPTHTWAPEAFWDPARRQYGVIYSAVVGPRNVIRVNYTTDFVTFSAPRTWLDPGVPVLDATVHTPGDGTYHTYYKTEADNRIVGARSTSLAPGSFDGAPYTVGRDGGGATEAPIVVRALTGNRWFLWGDVYTPVNGRFTAWTTTSIGTDSWTELSRRAYTPPLNSKHATITPITAAERSALERRWGLPGWNRLKSFNFPDRFVRHANFAARLDPYPFDPFSDAQFRLVPGLAGGGVSVRSATLPDHYLRHSGFEVRLVRGDGSAAFAADATFLREGGLADPGWSTFRSWNFPDRVLRHQGFGLRIDPIGPGSAPGEREDATFRVTS